MKTTFDDGTIVCTIDSRQPSLFKYPPDIKLTRSRAESARQLMDEHLRAVAAQNVNRRPIASPQSETLDSVVESNARVTLFQVERGLLRRTDHPNALRYTFSGAVKSTFKVWARFQFLRPSRA
jgi:hypothetical protein